MKKRILCVVLCVILSLLTLGQALPGALIGLISAAAADLPTTPHITLEKTEFEVGEDIVFTAWGDENTSVNFYPLSFVPGQDATIFYANFSDYGKDQGIPLNTPTKVTDMPGNNRGNAQVGHYYDRPLPAGEYKLVLRQSGTPILQVNVTVVPKKTDNPFEDLPTTPHITLEKTKFVVGEDIVFAAWGESDDSINFYPFDFVPGTDATIYWAYFEGSGQEKVVPLNTPIKVTDITGDNRGNWQVGHYYDKPLPAGEYKLVLRRSGTPFQQVNISIVEPIAVENMTIDGTVGVGKTVTLKGTVVNHSDTDRTFNIALSRPMLSTSAASESQTVTVKAGGSTDVAFRVTLQSGGSLLLGFNLCDEDGTVVSRAYTGATVPGPGFYAGDAHTHTVLSDGKNTLKDNFNSAYNKGQSWMFATDHNFEHANTAQTDAALKGLDGFLAVTGNEITSEYGHMLEYGTPHRHPTGMSGGMWEIMAAIKVDVAGWQKIMDEIVSEGGACYLAHPFFWSSTDTWVWPGIGKDPANVYSYTGFTGIEVYNSDSYGAYADTVGPEKTAQAFELWDRYNLKGEQHYFGICNTDGHTKDIVTTAVNVLMIDELSADSILATLKNGHYYGSNGPEMRFTLSDGTSAASFGETLPLPSSKKATLSINVGNQGSPLTKVTLYRYTMTGNVETAYEDREVTVLFDSEKDGEAFVFSYEKEVDVADGVFYRVEVEAVESAYGDYRRGGFAFSSPIWVGADIPLDPTNHDDPPSDTRPSDTEPTVTEPTDTTPAGTKPETATPDSAEVTTAEAPSEEPSEDADTDASTEAPAKSGCASAIGIASLLWMMLAALGILGKKKD